MITLRGWLTWLASDIVVVALALRYARRQVPREILLAAWPGEPRLLERLLGPARPATTDEKPT